MCIDDVEKLHRLPARTVSDRGTNSYLLIAEFLHNSKVNESKGQSPFYLYYGHIWHASPGESSWHG